MTKKLFIHDDRTNKAMKGIKVILEPKKALDGEVEYFEDLLNPEHFEGEIYKVRKKTKVDDSGFYYSDGYRWISMNNKVCIGRKKLIKLLQ